MIDRNITIYLIGMQGSGKSILRKFLLENYKEAELEIHTVQAAPDCNACFEKLAYKGNDRFYPINYDDE